MKKKLGRLKSSLSVWIPLMSFLGVLLVGIPLVFNYIRSGSLYVSQISKYTFFLYFAFFIFLIGIIFPIIKRILKFFEISKANPMDGLQTVLLYIASTIPLTILLVIFFLYLYFAEIPYFKRLFKYAHPIGHYVAAVTMQGMGVTIRYHGKLDPSVKVLGANHASMIDYPMICRVLGTEPWTVVAGINLYHNRKTIGDFFIASTIGKLVKDYSISIDRSDSASRQTVSFKIVKNLNAGIRVGIFMEGGRISKQEIANGLILKEFENGIFRILWSRQEAIQLVVFDWSAIYRGKGDDWWGVHPTTIDVYFLTPIHPKDFKTMLEFKQACWNAMFNQLQSSEKIQKYRKELHISKEN